MRKTLSLYTKLISISLKSQMQYRASFLMLLLGHAVATFADIVGLWILFDRFRLIKGWTIEELALLYGTVHMGFAIAEGLGRGFDTFSQVIKMGEFDRVLLRPVGTIIQVASREVQLFRLGRFLQGFLVVLLGAHSLGYSVLSYHTCILLSSLIGTTCLFYGLFIIQASFSFWTVESLELMNITTYGSVEAGQYPLSAYERPLQLFLTCLVPLGCVVYYPIASALHHELLSPLFALCLPGIGLIFLFLSLVLWHKGVRHYSSTGG